MPSRNQRRLDIGSCRTLVIALAATALLGWTPDAQAALKKYHLEVILINESTNNSPLVESKRFAHPGDPWSEPGSRAVIDESGASPVLKVLRYLRDGTDTVAVPQLGGFIYISDHSEQGPTGEFTGTGSTDTTIAWGLLTGWTISGTWWCRSAPSFVCDLANRVSNDSVDPLLLSPLYDLGTWHFHGTGWTGTPFVQQTYDEARANGNMQYYMYGRLLSDGTVPALPAVGLGFLGGSLVLGSLFALRRRRN